MYVGRNAVDPQGNKIGSVGQVYLNDETRQPDWITVNTGLFGMKENLAPLAGSSFNGDDLVLPFDKTVVKDSPDIADAGHLDVVNSNPCTPTTSGTSAPPAPAPPGPAAMSRPPPRVMPGMGGGRGMPLPARTPTRR
jgi:hypothetical protein